jgi:catalase (peroxidase I)
MLTTCLSRQLLQPVKDSFGDALSWADLISLAGTTALEELMGSAVMLPFCGGRTDASAGVPNSRTCMPTACCLLLVC